jgi:hypothetical protein
MSGEGEEELFVQAEADDNLEAQIEGEGTDQATDEVYIQFNSIRFLPLIVAPTVQIGGHRSRISPI